MLEKDKMARINFLANKAKSQKLSEEELLEQKKLRTEYLKSFRKSFKARLENLDIEYVEDLEKKN
ncbi:hypothetical protein HLPR_12860 [Helicovermis profundi]|uniref:UPF0291 protein HLPR_12860 n=2 Tax=Helicovermis profundi TaxID=3065157 RepID=A0AAU9EV32_9FIRM|nr:hypothetical protein HLPR_12860 [Clostridia bacterium S502]